LHLTPTFHIQGTLFCALCAALYYAFTFLLARRPSLNPVSSLSVAVAPAPAPAAVHCAAVPPIAAAEFHTRQTALARALAAHNASAYVAEPGAGAQFFGNISGRSWGLSERPLLLIVSPTDSSSHKDEDGDPGARVSVLTPAFEEARARLLPVPAADGVAYTAWAEDADPYAAAVTAVARRGGKIFVDGSIRHFIVDGLRRALSAASDDRHGAAAVVESAPPEITRLRERKSPAELAILKCANEVCITVVSLSPCPHSVLASST
jgi:Xaa-Pro aminopeptidase